MLNLIFNVFGVLLAIFLALILTYCIGRMFGAGFFKSFEGRLKQPISPGDITAKGEKYETPK